MLRPTPFLMCSGLSSGEVSHVGRNRTAVKNSMQQIDMTNGMIVCRLQILVAWGRLYLAYKPLLPLSEFLQSLANGVVRQLLFITVGVTRSDMGKLILFTEQWEFIGELLPNGREMFFKNFRFILVRCFNPAILSSDASSIGCADLPPAALCTSCQ